MKRILRPLLASFLGLSMIVGASAQQAAPVEQEAPAVVEVEKNPDGELSIEISAADFEAVPYSLTDQTVDADIVVTVTDDRGSDLGWNVTIVGKDFTDGTSTFDVENLVLSSETIVTGSPGSTQGITTSGGSVPEGPDSAKIITAETGSGTGQFTVTFEDSELTVPGGTLVGEYESTLTVSVSTGP